jgi:uncharacterized protein (UPF0548 family)
MWSLRKPTDAQLAAFLAEQANAAFCYLDVGATAEGRRPPKFDYDCNRVLVGKGEEVFGRACDALRKWRQFPESWTRIIPAAAPLQAGTTVVLIVRALGFWWWNSARIVYTIDETGSARRFGFAYGTLPAHVERGEERFTIEMSADGAVWYIIRAFSRPRMLAARIGYPIARRLQRKFVRDSKAAMLAAAGDL